MHAFTASAQSWQAWTQSETPGSGSEVGPSSPPEPEPELLPSNVQLVVSCVQVESMDVLKHS